MYRNCDSDLYFRSQCSNKTTQVLQNSREIASSQKKIDVLKEAAECMADSDLMSTSMGSAMDFTTLKYQACSNLECAMMCKGFLGQSQFPQFFGKLSKKNSMKRQLREMSTHLSSGVGYTIGPTPLRLDNHMAVLRNTLTRPLQSKGEDGIAEFIESLDQYGLTREDVMEKMPIFVVKSRTNANESSSEIQSKVKSKLTRTYNSKSGRIRQGVALTSIGGLDKDKIELVKKGKSKGKGKKTKKRKRKK